MIGQQKRPAELAVATQPAKYFRRSDVCVCNDADKVLKEDVDIVTEVSEGLKVEKHGGYAVKGEVMQPFLEGMSPVWRSEAETLLQTKQLLHDEIPLRELQALERMRPTLERQVQCNLQSGSGNVPFHRSHTQWLPSSFNPFQIQASQQTVLLPDFSNQEAQARYDMQGWLPYRKVPIGSDFQALVPVWKPLYMVNTAADEASKGEIDSDDADDDSRWLGLQVWPVESKDTGNEDGIGRGRSEACYCVYPGSIDCIRLHIQEENAKLKLTLGKAFELWGFSDMGESAAQHWTEGEQEQFKALVKSNPASLEKSFWHHLPSTFSTRSTGEIVNYYFNVFVLQRRAIQNRLYPDNIDSDDDECSLTGCEIEESEVYITDVEEEAEYEADGSEEDEEDVSWQNIIEGGTETSSEVSIFHETAIQNNQHISSKCDAGCFEDDVSNAGSMDDFMSSSTSKEDTLVDLQSVGHSIYSPQSFSSWHHDMQASEKHFEGTSYIVGEIGYQGSKTWNGHHWEEATHNLHKDSMAEIDVISDDKKLGSKDI
ncbi:hypothetical protein O6H91_09G060300 [Diphasiastrum complanatum]|nr:hypothetical protein O6H91_09G060300 [Diphasiastrum complanatum]KAJ7543961.1 hypothetical protein O6H91_09G060300 [Diphasiastrum complanatum]KAJ7543962.1 hypothetical protein O6H91_09G060300 [Diphasiastrum complanatum]KAJ7543963.1 hypothetical protein O6H91_09G060300 [Diphasiastrum complanatum]KAJ7543964.1 hypothetical protein O6H91_09G060300 [Diphasiastrum complanatum]